MLCSANICDGRNCRITAVDDVGAVCRARPISAVQMFSVTPVAIGLAQRSRAESRFHLRLGQRKILLGNRFPKTSTFRVQE